MNLRHLASVLLISTAALAAACISTTTSNRNRTESPSEAAKYNAMLGLEYMKRGELGKARDKIEKALEKDSNLAIAHTAAGMLYDRLGEPGKADKHFKAAIRLDPNDSELSNHYGVFLCRQDKVAEGEKMILKAVNDPAYLTPYLALTNVGLCMAGAGRRDEAERYFLKAVQMRPKFTRALGELAELKFAKGENLQARAYIERYVSASRESAQPDTDLPAILWLGVQVERALDNPATAEAYARRLKAEYPKAEQTRALNKSERPAG